MTGATTLFDFLGESARRWPDRTAVEAVPAGRLSFAALLDLADRARDRLHAAGVRPGDRVGVYARKSIDAYAVMLGAMKAGAAYVPIDAGTPAWRSAYIQADCAVKLIVLEQRLEAGWRAEAERLGPTPMCLCLDGPGDGTSLARALDMLDATEGPAPRRPDATISGDDLAYILYTSGSTGKPKGVMLTHRNAVSYVDWCSEVIQPLEDDRFSSHAPFHFDLSILDLYVPLKHGAAVVLIDADQGKEPAGLAALITERRLTVWYSTPTILTMLAQYGKMERHDFGALRFVLFAGEVFPVKHLRAIRDRLPKARFFNLYGPTETNVCTYFEIPTVVDAARSTPFPIGRVCEQFRARVVDERDADVELGTEGELVVAGPGVMRGYWNLPERTAAAFLVDPDGTLWYRTGDIVAEDADGVFTYVGRRDRMVKRRGYRIELGEIEAGLYRHPDVKEAAVVGLREAEGGIRIKAFLASNGAALSVVELKRFCAGALPGYMVPDAFGFLREMPKTSTDKIDYQRLEALG